MEQEFTVFENKIFGRNIYLNRKLKDKKAADIADYLGISEAAYTKYEHGEAKITIDLIQKVAEFYKIEAFSLLAGLNTFYVENVTNTNSPSAGINTGNSVDEKQTALILKLIESQIAMNEKLMALLEKK